MIKYSTKILKKAILNAEINESRKKPIPNWDGDAWDSFLEYIIQDDELLQTILNNADCETGIQDNKKMKVSIFLLKDLETYNATSSLIQFQIIILQNDNIFSRLYNYIWKFN